MMRSTEAGTCGPEEIEQRSFSIIEAELSRIHAEAGISRQRSPLEETIVRRVIHATADFDFDANLVFTHEAERIALELVCNGPTIITDTNMALAGINTGALEFFAGRALCFMGDADVAEAAREHNTTRASASIDKASRLQEPLVFAIGNAPTALFRIHHLLREGLLQARLVIACPVGFVNVVEAKELFLDSGLPCIVARGRKGGSAVAAAIVNALLYYGKQMTDP
ncbi:MAG: precorrin-8X methylmutase [Treponema sp.]|jgi:precorrin-8X/cobalt-precorrin-8 methylmutase|nr:precorrin-8X methylmutase [Treponema sp.]